MDTQDSMAGEIDMKRGDLVFTEQTINRIMDAAKLTITQQKMVFAPHRVHMEIHYNKERVEANSIHYDDTFGEWSQMLGYEIHLTPVATHCVLCQHSIHIIG